MKCGCRVLFKDSPRTVRKAMGTGDTIDTEIDFCPLHAAAEEMQKALEFYADPSTYFAIGFFPDPPCGEFMTDFDETELGNKPGQRARAVLSLTDPERKKP